LSYDSFYPNYVNVLKLLVTYDCNDATSYPSLVIYDCKAVVTFNISYYSLVLNAVIYPYKFDTSDISVLLLAVI